MESVLIVEDEPAVRKELMLFTPWDSLGLQVIGEATNGLLALDFIKNNTVDIVITDIRMPAMDGIALIQAINDYFVTKKEEVPEYLLLSGFSEFEYARKALRLGVMEYLLKPVDEKELCDSLLRARERRRARIFAESLAITKIKEVVETNTEGKVLEGYVARALDLMEKRFITGITVEEASHELGLSAGHFSRMFKQETGKTFLDYLQNIRIKRSIELLKDPRVKIYEIADLVGYTDSRYFTKVFKKAVGKTPTEFRASFFK